MLYQLNEEVKTFDGKITVEQLQNLVTPYKNDIPKNPRLNTMVSAKDGKDLKQEEFVNEKSQWVGLGLTSYGDRPLNVYFGNGVKWQHDVAKGACRFAKQEVPGFCFD